MRPHVFIFKLKFDLELAFGGKSNLNFFFQLTCLV